MAEIGGISGANSAPQVQINPVAPQNAPTTAGAIDNFKSQLVDVARNGSAVEAGKAKAELDKLTGSREKTDTLVDGYSRADMQSAAREFVQTTNAIHDSIGANGAALKTSVQKQ